MVKSWRQPVRLGLLAVILGSTLWVLGRAIGAPKVEKGVFRDAYPFPAEVPLPDWQPVSGAVLPADSALELPPGYRYQYRNQLSSLEVEARVMGGDDNVSRFLLLFTPIQGANVNLKVKYRSDIGFYGVLAHEGRVYLTACINRQGGSTLTEQQFMQKRHFNDFQVSRVLPWLLGQSALIDRRCLWSLMSIPLPTGAKTDVTNSEKTLKTLETAWFSWYRWWQPRFLKP